MHGSDGLGESGCGSMYYIFGFENKNQRNIAFHFNVTNSTLCLCIFQHKNPTKHINYGRWMWAWEVNQFGHWHALMWIRELVLLTEFGALSALRSKSFCIENGGAQSEVGITMKIWREKQYVSTIASLFGENRSVSVVGYSLFTMEMPQATMWDYNFRLVLFLQYLFVGRREQPKMGKCVFTHTTKIWMCDGRHFIIWMDQSNEVSKINCSFPNCSVSLNLVIAVYCAPNTHGKCHFIFHIFYLSMSYHFSIFSSYKN